MLKASRKDNLSAYLMLTPFFVFFLLFIIYPAFQNLFFSFTNYNLDTASWIGVKNVARLLEDTNFHKAFKNTCVYACVSVFALTFLGFLAAALLNKGIRGEKWLRLLKPDGVAAVEIGNGQGPAVAELLQKADVARISYCKDLTGTIRVVAGNKNICL